VAVCGKKCPLADTGGGGAGKQSCGVEFLVDEGCDLLMHGVDGAVAFDHDDAGGIAGGDLAVFVVDAAMKELVLALEACFVAFGAGGSVVAAAGAVEGLVEIGEQQEGEVGIEAAAQGLVHAQDDFAAELAAAALIGLARVSEAIAENDVAAVERGRDDFGDALGASGEHESQLGHGVEALGLRVEEQSTDAVADAGASRLAGDGDVETLGFEVRGEFAELRRFSGAIQALEGEEESARHEDRLQGTGCRVQAFEVWSSGFRVEGRAAMMNLNARKLAAVGGVIFLFALVVQPTAAVGFVLSLVLAPVVLFGLVLTPRSLWPAFDPERAVGAPILSRAALFQRPPPFSIL